MKRNKKYYILYKVERNSEGEIIDLTYLKEYTTLSNIVHEQRIHFNNLKSILNNEYTNNLKTFKDFTIIAETEEL